GRDACIVPHRGGAGLSHGGAPPGEDPARPGGVTTSVWLSGWLLPHARCRPRNCSGFAVATAYLVAVHKSESGPLSGRSGHAARVGSEASGGLPLNGACAGTRFYQFMSVGRGPFSAMREGWKLMRRQRRRSLHHSAAVLHRLLHLFEGTHAYRSVSMNTSQPMSPSACLILFFALSAAV